jgi:hypothetical protein
MRAGIVAVALGLLLLAAAGDAAASKRLADSCAREGPVRHGSAQVRVFGDRHDGDRHDGDMYACSLLNGRRIALGHNSISSGAPSYVRPIAVAKRLVAWHRKVCSRQSCSLGELVVAEVATGRRLFERVLPAGLWVDELVLWPDGSAAWIEASPDGTRTLHRRYQEHEVLAQGDVRELALSPGRGILYWLENGLPRSMQLRPDARFFPEYERRPRCGRAGETEHANGWVRVYLGSRLPDYFACSYETRRSYLLDEPDGSASFTVDVGPAALAGRLVAWYYGMCSPGHVPRSCTRNVVKLLDVRTGKRSVLLNVPERGTTVEQIVLKRNRSAALVQSGQVRIADGAGDRLAGTGAELALSHGSTLFWTQPGGSPAAAPLK